MLQFYKTYWDSNVKKKKKILPFQNTLGDEFVLLQVLFNNNNFKNYNTYFIFKTLFLILFKLGNYLV